MARSVKLAGRLPNCIIANRKTKRFILLRINGNPLDLPEGWGEWKDSLLDLERKAFRQIRTESEALECLPEDIVQFRV